MEDREDREVAHLIDKTSPEVADLVAVGLGLTLALVGVLSRSDQYCDQANIPEDLMLLCLAAQNKIITVLILVWLPIITYCLIGNYKMERIPRTNTARWSCCESENDYTNVIILYSELNDIGQWIDGRGLLNQNQFIDEQTYDYDYLQW